MPPFIQSNISNRLLSLLSESDFEYLAEHLEPVDLPARYVLSAAGEPISHAYFLDTGVASVVAARSDARRIEAGIIGREGFCNISLLMDVDQTPHDDFMQVAGRGYRIAAEDFKSVVDQNASIRKLLARFVHVFVIQTAQTTLANSTSLIDQRLARWLAMCNDRLDGNTLSITHEFLAMMLGVRRAGVTDTIHILEGRGLIKAERGKITINNRAKLERLAGASYGVPEAEYQRLIGAL